MELEQAIQNAVRKLGAGRVDAFEIFGLAENSLVIESKQQMVESFFRSVSRGIAIRAVRDGRVGFTSATDISLTAIGQAVKRVIESLDEVAPSDVVFFPALQKGESGLVEQKGRAVSEISDNEKICVAMLLESTAVATDSRIARVGHARYEEIVRFLTVVNSNGIHVAANRSLFSCGLKAIARSGNETQGAYDCSFSPRFEDLPIEDTAKRASRRAIDKLGGKSIASGEMPIIFAPRAAATLLKLIAPSFFADNAHKGKSAIAAKRGERIYRPEISIIDDGLLPDAYGSFPFDGEGIPRRRTVLVRNGVVEGWLYDASRAAKDGVFSTGNCLRNSLCHLPAIGVGNCFLKGGESDAPELFRSVGKGLFITDLIGLHTANHISGDFSLGAEGGVIEGGEVSSPVRGVTVAGNIHELFAHAAGLANDVTFFGEYGAPTVLVEELSVGS